MREATPANHLSRSGPVLNKGAGCAGVAACLEEVLREKDKENPFLGCKWFQGLEVGNRRWVIGNNRGKGGIN